MKRRQFLVLVFEGKELVDQLSNAVSLTEARRRAKAYRPQLKEGQRIVFGEIPD